MRFFNTAGPVNEQDHYCLPPLERWDLEEIIRLIDQKKYFVLHAPRQTGKTTCLLALMNYLNQEGRYRCVYVNVESAQAAREDVDRGISAILRRLATQARDLFDDSYPEQLLPDILATNSGVSALEEMLIGWAKKSPKPLVLLIDEIDSLVGDTLIAVLRQLRSGYAGRPKRFPQSILLCGVRNVQDYRIHSAQEKAIITGGSAFNIKAESLRLVDFRRDDMERLYGIHTVETGQVFTPEALDEAWLLTQGQPWLINALAYEVCFKIKTGRDRRQSITRAMIQAAKENLILRRETHLDQLTDKLQEERVRRVIAPMLSGVPVMGNLRPDDIQYVVDLGLLRQARNGELSIANPIYAEVIPRELAWTIQSGLSEKTAWYVTADGRLDMSKLLTAFQHFFQEHAEHWVERYQYKEAGPQLLLQAFLQRIVNGGGQIEREYGLGRMRTDLLVTWPYLVGQAGSAQEYRQAQEKGRQKIVIELKLLHKSRQATIDAGLAQTWEYLDRMQAAEGHLVIFDRTPEKSWEEKLFQDKQKYRGREIWIWGM
ncbi:ATP-binding protein [Heliophilum fasciatum]|uniref:AAA domain-containing protein n=1 Tax=Heliophilum fasciatum TaxID=35700 RepID=A0A4R2RLX9_9FIRM|nr:ATP-binding protein [Heliophilum fasciatum]MCW2277601.1 hypothetical protein [Heliophilum fasciatum]TCP64950.1 AAA domain-containing protein [Heliophilum fasciatum]